MSDNKKFLNQILQDRYYQPGESCWEDICERVSKFVANGNPAAYGKFKHLMLSKKFCPASPIVMSAGTKHPMLSSCFVLPLEDSMKGILKTISDSGEVTCSGGGIGFDFTPIRKRGSLIRSLGKNAALGPVGVLRMINGQVNELSQSGRRKGACMGSISVYHDDMPEFIRSKHIDGKISNFNLSVLVDDKFMESVTGKARQPAHVDKFDLICEQACRTGCPGLLFKDTINRNSRFLTEHGLEITAANTCVSGDTLVAVADGRDYVEIKELAEIGDDVLVHCVDPKTGESHVRMGRAPRLTRRNQDVYKVTLDDGSSIKVTNDHKFLLRDGSTAETKDLKSGDSLMSFMEKCDGGSFKVVSVEHVGKEDVYNITVDEFHTVSYVTDTNAETRVNKLPKISGISTRQCGEIPMPEYGNCLLGSVDISKFVDEKQPDETTPTFNFEGFESAMKIALDFVNSCIDVNVLPLKEQQDFMEKYRQIGVGITGFHDALILMGIMYGSPDSYIFANVIGKLMKACGDEKAKENNNIATLTMAPTGSVSLMLETGSFSIEPILYREMDRHYTDSKGNKHVYKIVHPLWENRANNGIDERLFIEAMEVEPEHHLKMVSIFQRYMDNAISKTIMLPSGSTPDDVRSIYINAWESGLKGVTVYVDKSKSEQVYSASAVDEVSESVGPDKQDDSRDEVSIIPSEKEKKKRPKSLDGKTYKCRNGSGSFYITINEHDSTAFEIFSTPNVNIEADPARSHEAVINTEALTRVISLCLRSGMDPKLIAEQLHRVKNQSIISLPRQIADILIEPILKKVKPQQWPRDAMHDECPQCHEFSYDFDGSCGYCSECGFSRCS